MIELTVAQAAPELEGLSAEEVLKWAVDTYGGRVALACSFGAEDVVLVDLLSRATDRPRVFAIDTGRLHGDTYEVAERLRERYGLSIETYYPEREAVETLEREQGFFSFRQSLDAGDDPSRHTGLHAFEFAPSRAREDNRVLSHAAGGGGLGRAS